METGKEVPQFNTFAEFWPYYLGEHSNPWNQKLHALGTTIALLILVAAFVAGKPLYLLAALVSGYFFAWVGHFMVEHNKPATFKYPFYSLAGDFKMYGLFITGQLKTASRQVSKSTER